MQKVKIFYKRIGVTSNGYAFSSLKSLSDMNISFPMLHAVMGPKFAEFISGGRTILVNTNGGWCLEDDEVEITAC